MEDPFSRRFAIRLAIGAAIVAFLPFLYGYLARPPGSTYLGTNFATDDAMVYAAWMRQAMDGQFLFDNRFAIEPQAGLTFNIYFLTLGWLAKVVGIPWAMAISRVGFTALFVWLTYRLVRKVTDDPYTQKLSVALVVIGGGLGFLAWHVFGVAFVRPSPLAGILGGRLPVDVWQTEGFVIPSMLVNGLFMASLCLIVGLLISVLEAKDSWKPVAWGATCFAVLMNIHSYDILIVALVLVAFLATSLARKQATAPWIGRVTLMVVGVVPAALWFAHVFKNDPVFQARAAVPTYAGNFQTVVAGYVLMVALGLYGVYRLPQPDAKRKAGIGIVAGALVLGFAMATGAGDGYWMSMPIWIFAYAASIAVCVLLAQESIGLNLIMCWGVVGLVAPYFPTAFQRKLAMGLSVPWAILAGLGFAAILVGRERGVRNLVAVFGIAILGGTGLQWFFRDLGLSRANVSNTTVHPVYLTTNMQQVLESLGSGKERRVVLAMPGVANPLGPDSFATPYLPDLNPIASGFAGVYTYAGHWGETPDYNRRRSEATLFFLRADDASRRAFLTEKGITHVIAPVPEAFPDIAKMNEGVALPDLTDLGEVLVDGDQFKLIRVSPSSTTN